eukprot:gnl/MRDRNA2_/MRDRNA2_506098_c0_seq1.p1 gnl/MRDRNA2_/MRDRNA2_506098_c0~~gnl/MRDRNA2_/MRDRNA2_506098_c0_seq1.p1  ORF type:complete len:134 (+),score=18.98 gnl/MRDRNA2_/MRDRNA2_506098_c0_seq1:63-464(+)
MPVCLTLLACIAEAQQSHEPAAITCQIKHASTIQKLFRIYHEHATRLDSIHLSASWTLSGHLTSQCAEQALLKTNGPEFEVIVQHTIQALGVDERVNTRIIANIAYGAARTVHGKKAQRLPRDFSFLSIADQP